MFFDAFYLLHRTGGLMKSSIYAEYNRQFIAAGVKERESFNNYSPKNKPNCKALFVCLIIYR